MLVIVLMLVMVMPMLVMNLGIVDHHGHVVFFESVKELSDVGSGEVLLLRLNQHLHITIKSTTLLST